MPRLLILNPAPFKGGRKIHGMDGKARPRCRICGRAVYGRNARLCNDCLADSMGGGCGGGACTGGVGCLTDETVGKVDGADALMDTPWGEV